MSDVNCVGVMYALERDAFAAMHIREINIFM